MIRLGDAAPPPAGSLSGYAALAQGSITIFVTFSFLSRQTSYIGGCLVERDAVGDDVAGIDLSLLDAFEQRLHIRLHVGLAHLHGDALTTVCASQRTMSGWMQTAKWRYTATCMNEDGL
jgi:hypothetical protein